MALGLKIQLENKNVIKTEYLNFVKELSNQKINLNINFDNSTLGSIEKQIDKIKQQFSNNIEFIPKINNSGINQISTQINNISKEIDNLGNKGKDIKLINTNDFKYEIKGVLTSLEEVKRVVKDLGIKNVVDIDVNGIDKTTQEITKFTVIMKEAEGILKTIQFKANETVKDSSTINYMGSVSKIKDSTNQILQQVDKFKSDYQQKLNNIKELNFVDDKKIIEFEKALNSLNVDNFKKSMDSVKKSFKELQNESNNYAKEFDKLVKLETESQQQIQESISKTVFKREEEKRLFEQNQTNASNKALEQEFKERDLIQQKISETMAKREEESRKEAELQAKYSNKALEQEKGRVSNLGNNIGSFSSEGLNMSSDINEIKKFAQENINAKASVTSLSESEDKLGNKIKTANISVNEGNNLVSRYKIILDETSSSIYKTSLGVQDLTTKNKSFKDTLKSALESVTGFSLISGAYFTTLAAMKDMIVYTGAMDNALTDLNKVVDLNKASLNDMRVSALDLGDVLGKDSVEVMNSMAEAGRQFKNVDDIREFARVSTMASNITDMNGQQAAKSLTTVMRVFKQNIGDVEKDLNSFNQIQNNYRISGEDLAHSIEKVGEAASQTGTNMHELNGITTSLVESTGLTGSEAGTSIRAILSRTYGLGRDGQDGKGMKGLKEYADVDVRDASGEFKSFSKILDETHESWNNMSKSQQMALAQAVGGREHYSQFMTIMENYKTVVDATNASINSQDSALNENAKFLSSTAGKLGQLKAANQRLTSDFINSDTTKGFIDFAKGIVNATDSMVKTLGSIPTLLSVASTALIGFNKNFQIFTNANGKIGISEGIKKSIEDYTNAYSKHLQVIQKANSTYLNTPTYLEKMNASMKALTSSTMASTIATTALNAVIGMGIGLAIGATITGIQKLINYYGDLDDKNKELIQTQNDNIQGRQSNIQQLEEMKKQYNEVEDRMNSMRANGLQPTIEDQKTMNDLNNKLAKMMPDLVSSFDSQGNAIINLSGNYDKLIEKQKEAMKQDALKVLSEAKNPKDVAENKAKKIKKDMNFESMSAGQRFVNNLPIIAPAITIAKEYVKGTEKLPIERQQMYNQKLKETDEWYKQFMPSILQASDGYNKLDKNMQSLVGNFANTNNAFKNMEIDEIRAKIELFTNALNKSDAQPVVKQIEELNAKAKDMSIDEYNKQLSKFLDDLARITKIDKKDLQKVFDIDVSGLKKNAEDVSNSLDKMIKSSDDLQKEFSGNLDDIKKYGEMLNSIKDKGHLTSSEKNEIIKKQPDLIPYLSDTNKLTQELTNRISDLKEKSQGAFSAIKIQEEEKSLQNLLSTYKNLSSKTELEDNDKQKLAQTIELLKGKVEGFTESKKGDDSATKSNIKLTDDRIKSLELEQRFLQAVGQVGVKKAKDMITAEVTQTKITYEQLQKRIEGYMGEYKLLQGIADFAKKTTVPGINDSTAKIFQQGADTKYQAAIDLQGQLNEVNNTIAKGMEDLSGAGKELDGITNTLTEDTSKNTDKTKANTAAQNALAEAIKKVKNEMKSYENQIKAVDNALYSLEKSMEGMDDTSDSYINALKLQNDMFKQRIDLVNNATQANNGFISSIGSMGGVGGSALGQQIVNGAEKYLGTPYVSGGEAPGGFDCSGLVQYVYSQVGVELNRTSQEQFKQGTPVSREQLQPGDLVFFKSDGSASAPGHVALYAGNGQYIHSPQTGDVVKMSSLSNRSDYVGARRIVSGGNPESSTSNAYGGYSGKYSDIINEASKKYGIPSALIAALIKQESDFNPNDVSSAGAVGLMQLMPELQKELGVTNPYDPYQNIMGGTQYLKQAINKTGGDYRTAVGYYNTGLYGNLNNSETQNHMKKVMEYYQQYGGSEKIGDTATGEIESILSKNEDYTKQNIDYNRKIIENNAKIFEAYIKRFDNQLAHVDKNKEKAQTLYELNKNSTSKDGIEEAEKQKSQIWKEINWHYSVLAEKEKYITSQLYSNNYDEKTKSEMLKTLEEVRIESEKTKVELHQEFDSWIQDRYSRSVQENNANIEKLKSQLELLESTDKNNHQAKLKINEQIIQQEELKKQKIQEQLKFVRDLLNNEKYDSTKEVWVQQIEKLNKELTDVKKNISEIKNSTVEAAKSAMDIINTVENKIAEMIKKDVEKKKEAYDKDLDNFRTTIEEKKKLLNDQYNSEDYQRKLADENKKKQDIQDKINVLSLDNTFEAQTQVVELKKQLAEQQKSIDDMVRQHNRDEETKSLDKQLSDQEKLVKEKKDSLDKQYTDEQINIMARQALIDGYYKDVNGNIQDIQTAYIAFETRFGDGMKTIGQSIENEFIAKLKEAKELINSTSKLNEIINSANTPSNNNNAINSNKTVVYGSGVDLENAKKYFAGYDYDFVNISDGKQYTASENDLIVGGSLVTENIQNNGAKRLWGKDRNATADAIKEYVKKLEVEGKSYANGGIITEREQIAILHGANANSSFEAVLNEPQLVNLTQSTIMDTLKNLDLSNILSNVQIPSILSNISLPSIPNISTINTSRDVNVHFDKLINVEGNMDKDCKIDMQKITSNVLNEFKNHLNTQGIFK